VFIYREVEVMVITVKIGQIFKNFLVSLYRFETLSSMVTN
jgi:hypothetical protein